MSHGRKHSKYDRLLNNAILKFTKGLEKYFEQKCFEILPNLFKLDQIDVFTKQLITLQYIERLDEIAKM